MAEGINVGQKHRCLEAPFLYQTCYILNLHDQEWPYIFEEIQDSHLTTLSVATNLVLWVQACMYLVFRGFGTVENVKTRTKGGAKTLTWTEIRTIEMIFFLPAL